MSDSEKAKNEPRFLAGLYVVNVADKNAVEAVKEITANCKKRGIPRPHIVALTNAQFRAIENSFRKI